MERIYISKRRWGSNKNNRVIIYFMQAKDQETTIYGLR